jgi:hypothetical protein
VIILCPVHGEPDQNCATCTARPERIVLERTGVAQADFDRKFPTGELKVDDIMGFLHEAD